jgi:hypothetical protein
VSYLRDIPRDLSAVHFCTVCKSAYSTYNEALVCSVTKVQHPFEVGAIVVESYPSWHWHDGPDHWVKGYGNPKGSADKRGQRTDSRGERQFYWVVTAIDSYAFIDRARPFNGHPDAHRPIYWVQTLGLTGKPSGGWSCNETHRKFELVKNPPPRVVKESRPLIGWKEHTLL